MKRTTNYVKTEKRFTIDSWCKLATLIMPRIPPPCSRRTVWMSLAWVYRMCLVACSKYSRCICLSRIMFEYSAFLSRLSRMTNRHGHWVLSRIMFEYSASLSCLSRMTNRHGHWVLSRIMFEYSAFLSCLSRMTNRHGHWVCWMSTGGKNTLIKNTHVSRTSCFIQKTASCV